MTLRLQSFFAGLLALLVAAVLAFAPASAKPASGGYQLFETGALEHQHHIQLASLENFDYFAKNASECCNAPNRTLPDGYRVVDDSVGAARPTLPEGHRWVADTDGTRLIQRPDGTFARTQADIDRIVVPGVSRPVGVPDEWITSPTRSGGGTSFSNPENRHDFVRVMPGNPDSPNPAQQRPYVIRSRNGQIVDVDGNPVASNDPAAHIPLSDFEF